MAIHEFDMIISGVDLNVEGMNAQDARAKVDQNFDDAVNRLYDAWSNELDDLHVGMSNLVITVSVDREAPTREEAVASATANVTKAGFAVASVSNVERSDA